MRITEDQKAHFISTIKGLTSEFELYLFGSRTDDRLHGGDIDLLLVVSDQEKPKIRERLYWLLNQFKKNPKVGDRKIDLLIANDDEVVQDPFYRQAKTQGLLLYP